MSRAPRNLYVDALDALLQGKIVPIARACDWELLREVAKLARSDAPIELARTDPALFQSWRAAVTQFHLKGWTNMTPEQVDRVAAGISQKARA